MDMKLEKQIHSADISQSMLAIPSLPLSLHPLDGRNEMPPTAPLILKSESRRKELQGREFTHSLEPIYSSAGTPPQPRIEVFQGQTWLSRLHDC
uniref:Uncharacterized protein n=1 Tax=Sphaerodactylus townsendi TaxID=933632 RepID=A0ACB8G7J7_9SAUR